MARHRDYRSPSPEYSSRRNRRDDRRDRRRSRSRSPPRRYRDNDAPRYRDRSRDRRDRDTYRSGHDRDRDYRRRSRDRDRRDPSRDRARDRDRDRRRRDGSTDSRRSDRRRDGRDRHSSSTAGGKAEAPKPSAAADEEAKKARLAKLEAWKQKVKAQQEGKQKEQLQSAAGTRSLLEEIDKKAAASPAAATGSPQSPAAPAEPEAPVPYAGKFDPKAIAKKAHASAAGTSKLGTDVLLPEQSKASATNSSQAGLKANTSTASAGPSKGKSSLSRSSLKSADSPLLLAPSVPLKARGNVSGFGLSSKVAPEQAGSTKRGLDFQEEDEGSRKKLEKLPTPPLDSQTADEDAALANGAKDEDEDEVDYADMADGTEEEAAAAARAAAEKRDERLQAESQVEKPETQPEDTAMETETPAKQPELAPVPSADAMQGVTNGEIKPSDDVKMAESNDVPEEEDDPLEAFMSNLADAPAKRPLITKARPGAGKPRQVAGEALFENEDNNMDAVEQGEENILALAAKKKKKKELPTTNHAKINYEPFEKSFYIEPSDFMDMTDEEVADVRFQLGDIKVVGTNVPKPALKWSQCGLSTQILEIIAKLKYDEPSAIQAQAIPTIMSGRDMIGVAKTGSGKTIAFLLPMFRHIKAQRPLANLEGPIGLVITPTRELAHQIYKDCKPFLKALNLQAVCAYGGAPIKDQIADLKTGAHIIVCTPGRMIDLLAANSGRVTNLRRVTYLVIDEADRMFDMGFEPQIMKIVNNARPDRQTVLFSATMPKQVESLALKTLKKHVEIMVGGRSVVAPEVTQVVEVRAEESKFHRLLELLGNLYQDDNEEDRALVFVNSQGTADRLLKELMRKYYSCMSIHGGKDQIDRDSTIDDFKSGVVPILIATSVAARGLDVKQLKLVVNYDAPNHLEDYVHRAGRTGRAGNTGTAVTFVTEDQERFAVDIAKALKQSGQAIPEDLQKLVDKHLADVKSGKSKNIYGFGGKGLERLDQERDAARNRERKTYKTGDEPDEEEKKEDSKEGDDLIAKAASGVQSAAAAPQSTQVPGVPKGIDLDGKITVHRTENPASGGGGAGAGGNPLDRVSAAVANITSRLNNTGVLRQGVPIDNKGPDAGAFHATLEINDFPQKARWAVTNRTNVAKILEATGTSITTKGSFYAAGKEPGPGENPKLYILVEGDTEVVVSTAMRELMRLLKDGALAAAESDSRAPAGGRYNVV